MYLPPPPQAAEKSFPVVTLHALGPFDLDHHILAVDPANNVRRAQRTEAVEVARQYP